MQPTLYILMRTDMESLNAGKAMAQAAHASNAFVYRYLATPEGSRDPDDVSGFDEWIGKKHPDTQGFGTTIVLAAPDLDSLNEAVLAASGTAHIAGTVLDHSYPVRDGSVTHLLPVITCGYVFTPCRKSRPVPALGTLALHK